MMIVILGAAGGVGRHAVRLAAERGHEVRALARRPHDIPVTTGVTPVAADVRDGDAVADALVGADAVLWCVGVTRTSGGDVGRAALPQVVAGMRKHGVPRFVGVSGAGVTVPGDRKGMGARLVSALTAALARDLVGDKLGEYRVLAASDLDWTQVRPPRLVEHPGTGRYGLGVVAPGPTAKPVTKADTALAMLDLAESRDWTGQAPFVTAG